MLEREDGSAGRALAGAAAGEGDAAAVVDPTGGDPAAPRSDAAAEGAGRGPPPLGSAPARLSAPRGLALLEVEPTPAPGAALGGIVQTSMFGQPQRVDSLLSVMAARKRSSTASTPSCVASPARTSAARPCNRSTGSGRSWPATCSPRSARHAASAAPTRSPAWPASIRSSTSRARAVGAVILRRPDRRTCAGRWSKPPCTRTGQPTPTSPSTELRANGATRPWPD
jgi:hypothetical protein